MLLRAPRCVASGKLDLPLAVFRISAYEPSVIERNTKYARNPATKVCHETGIPSPRSELVRVTKSAENVDMKDSFYLIAKINP